MPIALALSKVNRSRFFARFQAGGPAPKGPDLSSSSLKKDKCPEHPSGRGRSNKYKHGAFLVIYGVSVTVVIVPVEIALDAG
ncbi:hypothetical protein CDAR_262891 [Caerostris darwini]|uniref:Uncharacterized protein n=1 Tax=Caerostris darwini TaxID=1538125 RepID=A0AAV4RWU3_9ARAC|nr:hypothetical protein CDAR_262891 [Caerostris darwini]